MRHERTSSRLAWICLVSTGLALFAGCAIGPNYEEPEVESPAAFRTELAPPDSTSDLLWWELFTDSALDTLITAALEHNRDLRIAASRIEEARAFHGFTKVDLYPRIDVDGSISRGDFLGGAKSATILENAYIAPVLSWEIDFWGKFRRATEAARADLLATEFAYQTLQLGLISEVASTYFLLLDFSERLEISRRTLDSRLASLNIIQQRFDHGIVPEIDLNQAQIQKEIAQGAIPFHERAVSQTEHLLSVLVGRLPREISIELSLQERPNVPTIPVGLPSELLERRPDITEAQYLLHAQTARIGVAQAARLPSISLTGLLGVASSDLSSFEETWSIGGGLFGPLLDFGKAKRRVEVEEERAKQALYNYENVVLYAFRDVEDSLVEVETLSRQFSSAERKLAAAENAASLSRERYDKGVASYLEVLDSERTHFSVEIELSELRQQYRNSYVRLYKSLGGGWASREELEAIQSPPEE